MKFAAFSFLFLEIALCVALVRCGLSSHPTKFEITPEIRIEWGIAQLRLATVGLEDAYDVHPGMFRWREHPGPFKCGIYLANGCYTIGNSAIPSGLIRFNAETPTVVRHEAGHAILHKLGEDWRCYEHDYERCQQ